MNAHKLVHLYATLADMKEVDYKNTLAITTLIEILIKKGVITRAEVMRQAQKLDTASD